MDESTMAGTVRSTAALFAFMILGNSEYECAPTALSQRILDWKLSLPSRGSMIAFPSVLVLRQSFSVVFGVTAVLLLTSQYGWTRAHTTLGLHGLSGANPSGYPPLPAIQGAFETEIKVRFNNIATGTYHNLFEYSDDDESDTVWFGQMTSSSLDLVLFRVKEGSQKTECLGINTGMVVAGNIHTYKFGVGTANTTRIFMDGTLIAECPNMVLPLDVPRNHFVGSGPSESFPTIDRTLGAILGLRVTNLLVPQDTTSAFAFHNFPSQTYSSSFVASFYARFDNLTADDRGFQRVFDFGNGSPGNNILCGQFRSTAAMFCEVYDGGGTFHRLFAGKSIVEGEFAFWHFGIQHDSANGVWLFWIDKNGERVNEANKTLQVPNVFRRGLLLGESHWNNDHNLVGAALGFRLDRGGQIS